MGLQLGEALLRGGLLAALGLAQSRQLRAQPRCQRLRLHTCRPLLLQRLLRPAHDQTQTALTLSPSYALDLENNRQESAVTFNVGRAPWEPLLLALHNKSVQKITMPAGTTKASPGLMQLR